MPEPQKPRDWKAEIQKFAVAYEEIRVKNPDWPLNKIASHLAKGSRTTYRMLAVARHLDDPRISSAESLNKAYVAIQIHYQSPTNTISEITKTMDSIVPLGGKRNV